MSDFKANVVGMEYHNISGTGWPDSVEVENEGDIFAGTYESRRYVPERTCKPIRRGTIISCGACGSELHEPFRFCGGCGAKVVES